MSKFLNNNECCEPERPNGGNGNGDCVSDWKRAHEAAKQEYNIKAALAAQGEARYQNSQAWENKLDTWFNQIHSTHEKAEAIRFELGFFIEQIKTVCKNAECTNEAMEVLLCKVKAIFDILYTYNDNDKGLKELVADLRKKIECLKDSKVNSAELVECIDEFEAKLKVICECQDAVLKAVIKVYRDAQALFAAICDKDCGLRKCIEDILKCFEGESKVEDEHCNPGEPVEEPDGEEPYPCDTQDQSRPSMDQPSFPLNEDDFYTNTETQLETAKERTASYKVSWTDARKARDKALSRMNSLSEAIQAAEAAESGK